LRSALLFVLDVISFLGWNLVVKQESFPDSQARTDSEIQCWCGNSVAAATLAPATDCSFTCGGNSGELCGAAGRLSLYNSTIPVPVAPIPLPVQISGAFSHVGCYTEAANYQRELIGYEIANFVAMTVEACAVACGGFTYFGTEYGGERKPSFSLFSPSFLP
jgi:hypothetical protein